jgi:hypothetical protein
MPSSRPEDAIRELCSECVNARDQTELEAAVEKLKVALHEHVERLGELTARRVAASGRN